jgi:hypothetical protein
MFMENLERIEYLSSAELATLRKRRQPLLVVLIAVAVVTPAVFALGAILSGSWLYMALIFLVDLALVFLVLRGSIRKFLSLNKDIREGKKRTVVNRIESQRQDIRQGGDSDNPRMVYTYLITVKDKELEVNETQYYQCKPGQLVEIQLAPNSNHVFSVNVFKD